MPKLSIVIPTYNEERHIAPLLQSIESQAFKDLEVIVADAYSRDNTPVLAQAYGAKVIEGGTPSYGRNRGGEAAKSPMLCFIDADSKLPDSMFLTKALKEIESRKLDIAGTMQQPGKSKGFMNSLFYKVFYEITNLGLRASERTKNPFMQICMFAKKEVFDSVKGFPDYEFGEDSAFAKIAVNDFGYRFGTLVKCGKVLSSPRRFEKHGFWPMVGKYIRLNAVRLLGQEFERGSRINYWC